MNEFEPKQFGKYYLLDKLAVGGMAEIYKAKTFGVDGFEKQLAIKRILPHCAADKEFITMLIDEAKLSVLLSHANIVQVFDLGKVGDDYFIAMEFISGINLRDIIYSCRDTNKTLPVEVAAYITSEICKGLDYAHRKTDNNHKPLNIVHRDVSPQNVLISYEGEVKIVDFGIAKAAMNISHTMAGILKGKIAYMSPEQALGKKIDHRTDIFSAGILLYEMLTGQKLFTGESQFEVLKKIRDAKISPDIFPETIPEALRPILAKALSPKLAERFENAADFQTGLTKFLYTVYPDFSPRKLAAFLKTNFKTEMKEINMQDARISAFEQQTSSMSIKESDKQVELVHSDSPDSDKTAPGVIEKPKSRKGKKQKSKAVSEDPTERGGPKVKRKWLGAMIASLIAGTSALAALTFIPELRFWEQASTPGAIGIVNITSNPTGAKIFLDDNELKEITPAKLAKLELNREYSARLELKDHGAITKSFTLKDATPLDLSFKLEKAKGVLNIISDPTGAAIMLDGRLTGMTTPATLEKLPLNTDLRITISKPEYEDFEQVITLNSAKPQKVSKRLKKLLPERGGIAITSTPSGASVLIDGKATGRTTPATISNLKLNKNINVTLAMKGFDRWKRSITLKDPKTIPLDATLKAEVSKPAPELSQPAPEVSKPASMVVSSKPSGATLFVDGQKRGKTPVTLEDLSISKTYKLRFVKDGYQTATRRKTINKASEKFLAKLKLKPKKPVAKTSVPKGSGKIVLASTPSGADVFINAEHRGKTPLTVSVPAGTVSVLVSKPGKSRFSKKIKLKAGKTVSLTDITLGELYGEVSIVSTPARASVIFDGQEIPKTPVTIRKVRTDKPHTIEIKLKGHLPWSRSFNMNGKSEMSFNVILEKD